MARRNVVLSLCLFALLAVAFSQGRAAEPSAAEPSAAKPTEKLRIVMAGDSTMANGKDPAVAAGWGQVFGDCFKDNVEVINLARGGASSKSFIKLGLWQKVVDAKGDYIFIQFGHNDQPGKGPERETTPEGEYSANLRRFIDEARQSGAEPVLVTSVARRTFSGGKLTDTLGPYADATKAVAAEKKVPVIDLHRLSMALYEKLGDEGGADLNSSPTDRTHFSRKGADTIAGLVAAAVREQVPTLAPYLK